jgi:ribA/ribD-fused uncharacterized protein
MITEKTPMRTVQWVIDHQNDEDFPGFIFFWGGHFSQWASAPFADADGVVYPTAEHYMMAHKARVFGDEAAEVLIQATTNPKEAKKLGRKIIGFSDEVWNQHKIGVVIAGSILKFKSDPVLLEYILSSDKVIVEASPYDTVWGIGLSETNTYRHDANNWRGKNLLGFCLMEARQYLRINQERMA